MPKEIELRRATLDDVPLLAEMNAQLIKDEGSLNDMTHEALEERLTGWLTGQRGGVIVERKGDVIGYMLFWRHADEFYPYKDSIYIRQFFIKRSFRRRGIGQIAFDLIVAQFFAEGTAITLDVLQSNPEGKAFWQKMGFYEYHTTMRRDTVSS